MIVKHLNCMDKQGLLGAEEDMESAMYELLHISTIMNEAEEVGELDWRSAGR